MATLARLVPARRCASALHTGAGVGAALNVLARRRFYSVLWLTRTGDLWQVDHDNVTFLNKYMQHAVLRGACFRSWWTHVICCNAEVPSELKRSSLRWPTERLLPHDLKHLTVILSYTCLHMFARGNSAPVALAGKGIRRTLTARCEIYSITYLLS